MKYVSQNHIFSGINLIFLVMSRRFEHLKLYKGKGRLKLPENTATPLKLDMSKARNTENSKRFFIKLFFVYNNNIIIFSIFQYSCILCFSSFFFFFLLFSSFFFFFLLFSSFFFFFLLFLLFSWIKILYCSNSYLYRLYIIYYIYN